MRESILWLHRWLGLTAGVVFAIASATGAVLVYQPELDRLLGGPRWELTAGTQRVEAIEAAVLEAHPGARIREMAWPGDENVVRVGISEAGRNGNVWVDNGSGRVVEPRPQLMVLLAIRRLHVNLFMGRFGRMLVTWATAAALIAMVLSIYLWWPGLRKFWNGFRIRLGRGTYILNFDLHQALGILALPLLVFGSATGVMMVYGGVVDRIERAVHGPLSETEWVGVHSAVPADEPAGTVRLASVVAQARARAPDAALRLVRVPESPDGAIEAELASDDGSSVRVAFDRYTGAVLRMRRSEPPPFRFDRHTNEQLHVANAGGPVFAILYLLSCVIGFLMLPTGVTMWWLKRMRKTESAERRAARRAGEPAGMT